MAKGRAPTISRLDPGSPSAPTPFGKYYLLGLIARGGMAEVYRARLQDAPGDLCAIKVMRPQIEREARFVDMFLREAELAIMLTSDAIVQTAEVGQIDGRHYIAMEYIPGCDLTKLLRHCQKANQRIPVPHAVYVAARIAHALAFAHDLCDGQGRPLNLVNRDVSPSNVRVSYDGEVKMLDFGIAQALMKFTSEIGVLKGKFSYMSPEQIRGMPLDARSDLFSAGIILHEMLTTEKLFRGDTEFQLMEKVRKAEVKPPSTYNRRVPERLDAIALRALARDVGDRYQRAQELAADLDELLAGYRFQLTELQHFMRQQFRGEFAAEQADAQIARSSSPLARGAVRDEDEEDDPPEILGRPSEAGARRPSGTAPALAVAEPGPAPPTASGEAAVGDASVGEASGLLSRLFRRRR